MKPIHKQITILEDDEDIRDLCTYILVEEGYSVKGYSEVTSFLRGLTPSNLFLLDIRLPDGNGLQVCERLKSDPQYANIPVIMMSAHLQKNAFEGSRADDFIEKPFDISQMVKHIAKFV